MSFISYIKYQLHATRRIIQTFKCTVNSTSLKQNIKWAHAYSWAFWSWIRTEIFLISNRLSIKLSINMIHISYITFNTNISPVVRFISNLLFAGLSGSIPCPVKKYTIFCGRSLSPSDATTCIFQGMLDVNQSKKYVNELKSWRISISFKR